jgi:hypothetical protein
MVDVENPASESTPLVGGAGYSPDNEPPPLKDMKEQTLKERLVGAASLVGREYSINFAAYPCNYYRTDSTVLAKICHFVRLMF